MKDYPYRTADGSVYGRLKELARRNRSNPTEAESLLWSMVKGGRLGAKFKRQHTISCFIADFVCLEHGLIVEIDGGYHNLPDQRTSDNERTGWLESQGFEVIRFTNAEVMQNTNNVLQQIKEKIKQHGAQHKSNLPPRGERRGGL